jgi:hypothetical protein
VYRVKCGKANVSQYKVSNNYYIILVFVMQAEGILLREAEGNTRRAQHHIVLHLPLYITRMFPW